MSAHKLYINGVSLGKKPQVTSGTTPRTDLGVMRWWVDASVPFNERNEALVRRSWFDCLEVKVTFDGVDEFNPKLQRSGRGAAFITEFSVDARSGRNIELHIHLRGTRRLYKL